MFDKGGIMGKIFLVFAFFYFATLTNLKSTLIFNDEIEYHNFSQSVFYKKILNDLVLLENEKPYDVLEYDLYLDWYNVMKKATSMDSIDRIWYGVNRIKLESKIDDLEVIELDAASLLIDSVFVQKGESIWKIQPTPKIIGKKLMITVPNKIQKGEVLKVIVFYTYARYIPEENYRGFFLYPKGKYVGRLPAPFYDSVFVEERLAYTMSEPEDARYWMPCNDAPYDKADAKITVRVPKEYIVASNGYLDKVVSDGDSAKIYYWISDKPLTTYLMAVTVSKYIKYSDWYRKVTSPNDSVEIQYYVWEKDYKATKTDGSEYNARNTFQTTPKMMEFFSKTFGEYPFVKYGMVAIMPFHFGGMEHQTITSINRAWLRQNVQFGIAHELAHHWIGDLVTCATWNDIWFNEGGATWSEALYAENLWGDWGYELFILSSRREYLKKGGLSLPPIYGLPTNVIFGDYAVLVYQKASWIYHMLREMLGNDLFFRTFRGFLKKYSFKSITTEDFIDYFEQNIPNPKVNFRTFFDQWLFKAGHPVFSVNSIIHKYQNDSGYYDAEIVLIQNQSGNNVPDIFVTPLRLIFSVGDTLKISQTFLVDQRVSVFKTALPFFPDSIFIDTTSVLCEVNNITLSYNEKVKKDDYSIFPNPVGKDQSLCVKLWDTTVQTIKLEIYDILGNLLFNKECNISTEEDIIVLPEVAKLEVGPYILSIFGKEFRCFLFYKQ